MGIVGGNAGVAAQKQALGGAERVRPGGERPLPQNLSEQAYLAERGVAAGRPDCGG